MICIYRAINLINGKIYIGRTNNLRRRINEHKAHASKDGGDFHHDILKYGFENFQFEVLEETEEKLLDNKEIEYIAQYRTIYGEDKIYNICKGGLGGQTHNVTGENNPMYHKSVSQERRQYLSKITKGKSKPEGFGEKISQKLKGKKKSPEAVAKKSIPITLINIKTNEIKTFPSKSEMERQIHTSTCVVEAGKTTKTGWKIYNSEV